MVCDKEEEAEDAEAGEEAGGTDLKTKTPHKVVGKNIFMLNITNPCGDSQNHLLDLLLDWTLLDLNVFTAWKAKTPGNFVADGCVSEHGLVCQNMAE